MWIITIQYNFIVFKLLSTQLHPAHSRVGRETLVLRNTIPPFPPNFRGIAYWMAEINTVLCLPRHQSKEGKKIFNFSDRGSTVSRAYSHTLLPLRHNWRNLLLYRKILVYIAKFLQNKKIITLYISIINELPNVRLERRMKL